MAFLETPRFPEKISYGATGGPQWMTDVLSSASGHEQRIQRWAAARRSYDVSHGAKTPALFAELLAFFHAVGGRYHAFRYKDWSDFQVIGTQGVLVALSGTTWQMYKRYSAGALSHDRKLVKIVSGTTVVSGGGTYTVDANTGVITKTGGADPTGFTCQFDTPARFDTDQMRATLEDYRATTWGQIPIVEVRV